MVKKKTRRNKKKGQRKKKKKLYSLIFIEFIILIFLIPTFFSLSFIVGCGYLFAFIGSIYNKTIFKKKHVARLIIIGSVITYIAGAILKYGLGQNEIVAFTMIIVVGLSIWYYGYRLKVKGRRGK